MLWGWQAALTLPLRQSPAIRCPVYLGMPASGLRGQEGHSGLHTHGAGLLGAMAASPAVRATLQGTGTQLRDTRARKEQLAARVQEVQAMLAMDTGRLGLPPPSLTASPEVNSHLPATPPLLPRGTPGWGTSHRATTGTAEGDLQGVTLYLQNRLWSRDKHQTK